jgi:hypothetical protein
MPPRHRIKFLLGSSVCAVCCHKSSALITNCFRFNESTGGRTGYNPRMYRHQRVMRAPHRRHDRPLRADRARQVFQGDAGVAVAAASGARRQPNCSFMTCCAPEVCGGLFQRHRPKKKWRAAEISKMRNKLYSPESLIREYFHALHSFAPKLVGRKEIICASSSSLRPRRAANSAVASCGSSWLSRPTLALAWTMNCSSA